jgi:hypothetical protein
MIVQASPDPRASGLRYQQTAGEINRRRNPENREAGRDICIVTPNQTERSLAFRDFQAEPSHRRMSGEPACDRGKQADPHPALIKPRIAASSSPSQAIVSFSRARANILSISVRCQ